MTAAEIPATLLVIDMQRSVLAECADVPGVTGRINELARQARAAGAAVVFIQHTDSDDPEMAAGSGGWQLAQALERLDGDALVPKTYRDSFAETALAALLAGSRTRRVVVTGAHSDFCVQTTALSALVRGYDVTLVSDAHTARPVALPEGELSAESIVAFVNSRFATLRYPGRTVEVLSAVDVSW
jgi:nicotinamidase-related amidase